MTERTQHFLIAAVFILAAFLRFWHITETPPGLYPDEAMNGNNALEALATSHFKVFYPENNGREGLFINLQAITLKLVPSREPWVLRLPAAIFGTLTVIGFFFLLRELAFLAKLRSQFLVSFLGSFFLATSVWHIIFSRIGFRAVMAPFCLVFALYFLLLAFRRTSLWPAAVSGIFLGLGVYTYIAFRVTPLIFLFLLPFLRKRKEFWAISITFLIAAAAVSLPLLLYFVAHPADFFGRTSELSIWHSPTPSMDFLKNVVLTAGMFNFHGDSNWRHNIAGAPEVFWPVGLLFLYGIFIALRRGNALDRLALGWMLVAALPVVISNEGIPHALRAILMAPAVFILAASGGMAVAEYLKRHLSRYQFNVVAALFIVLLVYQGYAAYFKTWGQDPNVPGAFSASYVDIGRAINRLPANVDKYVVVAAPGVMVRGIPMPAQTVMFMTGSFLPASQAAKHIHYLSKGEYRALKSTLGGSPVFVVN